MSRLDAVEPRGADVHEVLDGVRAALRAARADVLLDLSDEPVVGYRERFLLMSAALAEGAAYVASDTEVSARSGSSASRGRPRWRSSAPASASARRP